LAKVAFLVDAAHADVDLTPAAADRLAGLGVTSLEVFRDRETLCLVLDGWAFDSSAAPAAASVIGVEPRARTLHPVMQTALRATR
jgi:hypothetical protein